MGSSDSNLRVIVVDKHDTPGGQWHDSYKFVQLHQPSYGYGVESKMVETTGEDDKLTHRATRAELLKYYDDVKNDLESKYDFVFLGNTTFDLSQLHDGNPDRELYTITDDKTGVSKTIRVRQRLVDARNLEPDLPVSTPPKFNYPSSDISVLPVNDLVTSQEAKTKKYFVVIGGGKTGMDAVTYLLKELKVDPTKNLVWIVPNQPWITARENIGNCIDLLYTSAKLHDSNESQEEEKKDGEIGPDFFQRGFIEWEKEGHIYRFDKSVTPTKFKDATLSLEELKLLQTAVPSMISRARISEITSNGTLVFVDGTKMEFPFPSLEETLFLHCSAGAFHFTKSNASPPPIFEKKRIIVQDMYGTPGFCFVGSMLGKLESMTSLTDDEKNDMTKRPEPNPDDPPVPKLGKSGGDVLGDVSKDHQFIQRAQNLEMWMKNPELKEWLFKNHLFHMAGVDPKSVEGKLDFIFKVLRKNGIFSNSINGKRK